MNRHLGEKKLNNNLSKLKKTRVKREIAFSFYILFNKLLSFFTKNSLEKKIKEMSNELSNLKYENDELKKNLLEIEKEKQGFKNQIDDLLNKVDLSEFQNLKEKSLNAESWKEEIENYQNFSLKLENFFQEIEVNELIRECLEALEKAKDNFQKLKVVRHFLDEFKQFAWMEKKLTIFYLGKEAKNNIKDMSLVTEILNKIQKELMLDKQIKILKKDYKLIIKQSTELKV